MITVKELWAAPENFSDVSLCGWLRTSRRSKSIAFLNLSDGSCLQTVQLVAEESLPDFDAVSALGTGTSVRVEGRVVLTPDAKQPFEVVIKSLTVEGACPPEYPLQNKRHTMEFLRGIAHLRPRANTFLAAFRIRSECSYAIHDFFHSRGFVYVQTPIITGSDCEGAGEMFRVTTLPPGETDLSKDFFGKATGLTVSGQLEAEAFALAFGKTYTFGPTFRAERSNTPRHAAEFWMIEPEIAFADLQDDMRLAEDMVKYIVRYLLAHCRTELEFCDSFIEKGLIARLEALIAEPFAHMTYTQAIAELEKATDSFEYPIFWGCDLQTEHERYLTEKVAKKPVFVTDYPKEIKAFYMRLSDNGKTVAAMDLLLPAVGELIGGSQREERLDILCTRLEECGLNPCDYEWYLDLRRFGSAKHAGFGLGFERLLMAVTGIKNIRDVLPFPRTPGHAEF